MSEKYVQVRNLTGNAQQIIHHGTIYKLGAHQEASFPEALAEVIVAQLAPAVERADLFESTVEVDTAKPRTMWLANMTGDPDAQEFVEGAKKFDAKTQSMRADKIPNTGKQAITVSRNMRQKEKMVATKSGMNLFAPPPKKLEIKPYRRKEFLYAEAQFMLSRERRRLAGLGAVTPLVVQCDAPREFEPTIKWSLDDLRLYLKLAWPDANEAHLGQSEAQIKSKSKNKSSDAVGKVETAKAEVFKRILIKVLFNRRVKAPTQAQWDAYKAKVEGRDLNDVSAFAADVVPADLSATIE